MLNEVDKDILKFQKPYKDWYQSNIGLDFEDIALSKLDEKWIISFEGIDATGKQTLSNLLMDKFNEFFEGDLARKVNIPDYTSHSGIEIRNILFSGKYEPEALQLKFALNRKEVQNRLITENKILVKNGFQAKNIILFDRWVDSGTIFGVSKIIYEALNFNSSMSLEDLESKQNEIIDKLFEYKNILIKQFELEHGLLQLVKPHIKVLCTTPVDIISKRLRQRLIDSGISENEVENHLDSHEKNLAFLYLTQFLYSYVYSNPKIFFVSEIFGGRRSNILILDTEKNNQQECLETILKKLKDYK